MRRPIHRRPPAGDARGAARVDGSAIHLQRLLDNHRRRAFPVELLFAGRPHRAAQVRIAEQLDNRRGQGVHVARRHQQPRAALLHHFRQTANPRGDDRFGEAVGHGDHAALRGFHIRQRHDACLLEKLVPQLIADPIVMYDEPPRVGHQPAIVVEIFASPANDDLGRRDASVDDRLGANEKLQPLVLPNAAEKQNIRCGGFVGNRRRRIRRAQRDVGHEIHAVGRKFQLIDDAIAYVLRVNDQPIRSAVAVVKDALRRLARCGVARVVAGVVDGGHQWKTPQQRQPQVEPQVAVVEVNDIRLEPRYRPLHGPNAEILPQRLPQARLLEGHALDGRVDRQFARLKHFCRHQQHHFRAAGHFIDLPDTVLAERIGDQGDFHRAASCNSEMLCPYFTPACFACDGSGWISWPQSLVYP